MRIIYKNLVRISSFFLILLFGSFIVYAYSTGITGVTKKNGDGCSCHNPTPSGNVSVAITGPAVVQINSTNNYDLTISGGPLTRGGTNIAALTGTLNTVNAELQKIGAELTHIQPKAVSGGSVTFSFSYTAPAAEGFDTLYANGNSVNFNGQNTGDEWNFASNFAVQVLVDVPVELASFISSVDDNIVTLMWKTVTEKNNYGFEIQRSAYSDQRIAEWEKIGFVKGFGTVSEVKNYTFTETISESGRYFYRLRQIDLGGTSTYYKLNSEVSISIPFEFALSQNFPNPFNPSTTIEFALPFSGNVKLKIYNTLGVETAELINEQKDAGRYSIKFDGSLIGGGLASGVYYYKIDVTNMDNRSSISSVKKMILMK